MNETAPVQSQGFYTEDMTISVGPQHPSTHGVLRFVVKTDGEVINEAIPDVGYLHRSIEKIGEKVDLAWIRAIHGSGRLSCRHVRQSSFLHGGGKARWNRSYTPGGILPGDRVRAQSDRQPLDLRRHLWPGHRRHDAVRPRAPGAGDHQ